MPTAISSDSQRGGRWLDGCFGVKVGVLRRQGESHGLPTVGDSSKGKNSTHIHKNNTHTNPLLHTFPTHNTQHKSTAGRKKESHPWPRGKGSGAAEEAKTAGNAGGLTETAGMSCSTPAASQERERGELMCAATRRGKLVCYRGYCAMEEGVGMLDNAQPRPKEDGSLGDTA